MCDDHDRLDVPVHHDGVTMGVPVWVWDDAAGRRMAVRSGATKPAGVPADALEGDTDGALWLAEIDAELERIDIRSIRSLRENNRGRIDQYEAEAAALRTLRAAVVPYL